MAVAEENFELYFKLQETKMRPKSLAHKMEWDYEFIQPRKKVLSVIMP